MAVDTAEPRFESESVRLSAPLRHRQDIDVRWAVKVVLRRIVSHHSPGHTGSRRPDRWLPEPKEDHRVALLTPTQGATTPPEIV